MAPSSSPTQAPIAIIGGGPCGLTLARLLERAGLAYVVFERDTSSSSSSNHQHNQGGSLDLHGSTGQAALEAAGLREEFDRLARREGAVFTAQDFKEQNYFRHEESGDDAGADRPEIDRWQLREMLLGSIPEGRVRWGMGVRSVGWRDGKGKGAGDVVLRFADGSEESGFRMVVGADGAWSKVRPLITPAQPKYSGKMYLEGRLSPGNPRYAAAQALAGPGLACTMGAGRLLVVQQLSDESYRVYAGLEEPDLDITRPGGVLDIAQPEEAFKTTLLTSFFADWAPGLRTIIEHAEGPWRAWPLYTLHPEAFVPAAEGGMWTRAPGVALIGDAAHVTLPNGEGVNLAMLDALTLSRFLVAELHKDEDGGEDHDGAAAIERAIVAYEAEMLPRAREHVTSGVEMNDIMWRADGPQRLAEMFRGFAEEAAKEAAQKAAQKA